MPVRSDVDQFYVEEGANRANDILRLVEGNGVAPFVKSRG
jgi:hypothetical protein